MNTPAHLLIGAAVFGRRGGTGLAVAALGGALLPDASLYVMASVALFVLHIPPKVVFDELYYSPLWQTVFAIDNSFVVWGMLCAVSIWSRKPWAIALTGAALLHLCLDFPLHHDDGRPHFWPISGWVYESPLSYWDRQQGAAWIAPVGAAVSAVAAIVLWSEWSSLWMRILVVVLLCAEVWVVWQWLFVFVDT